MDLVWFITGLRPVEVSVRGVEGPFPNGNVGYLWSIGQVVWENGAVLSLLNGLGYPDGLAGQSIPLLARIISIADAYDAMTSKRAYRGAMSREDSIVELRRNRGRQFDPGILDAFLLLIEQRVLP